MAANRAGIVFAEAVLSSRISLEDLAAAFRAEDYVPSLDDLPAPLTEQEFREQFGSLDDARFAAELRRLEARVKALPAYQRPAASSGQAPSVVTPGARR
jgi:hypothetical protein